MQFDYDPDLLIEEVKKRPGLWDVNCFDYRSRKKRRNLWTEVVTELNPSTKDTTKSELRALEFQLQKKWKGIRDCFMKYANNPNRTKRPYIYSKQLQFLIGDSDLPVKDRGSSDSEQETQNLVWKRKSVVSLKMDTNDITDDETGNNDEYDHSIGDDENNAYDVIIPTGDSKAGDNEFAFQNVGISAPRADCDDPDRLFLLSLLPHMKAVPEHCKLNVKMELLQVLKNANYSPK